MYLDTKALIELSVTGTNILDCKLFTSSDFGSTLLKLS